MINTVFKLFIATLCLSAVATSHSALPSDDAKRWDFRVLLDDKEIGQHVIETNYANNTQTVESIAQFDVRFLFIKAFSYQHSAVEQWQNNCLSALQSNTRTNSKEVAVNGEVTDGELVIESFKNQGPRNSMKLADERSLEGCVRTFAYWNPEILSAERLLNSQTGDYVKVNIIPLGQDTVTVDSMSVDAVKYNIQSVESYNGKPIDITLWYSSETLHWLALESPAKGNRVIRYELKNAPRTKLFPEFNNAIEKASVNAISENTTLSADRRLQF